MTTQDPEGLTQRDDVADLHAAVHARRELGPELEDQLIESFLARVQQRVDERVAQQTAASGSKPVVKSSKNDRVEVEVIVGTFALAIPLMAIAQGAAGGLGVFMVMVGVVAVNLLYFIDRWVRFSLR